MAFLSSFFAGSPYTLYPEYLSWFHQQFLPVHLSEVNFSPETILASLLFPGVEIFNLSENMELFETLGKTLEFFARKMCAYCLIVHTVSRILVASHPQIYVLSLSDPVYLIIHASVPRTFKSIELAEEFVWVFP